MPTLPAADTILGHGLMFSVSVIFERGEYCLAGGFLFSTLKLLRFWSPLVAINNFTVKLSGAKGGLTVMR